jgi:hypothetical protein
MFPGNKAGDIGPHFIAAWADRRPYEGVNILRQQFEFIAESADSLLENAADSAPPSGMHHGSNTAPGMSKNNGKTIGCQHHDGKRRGGSEKSIGFRNALRGNESSPSGKRFIDKAYIERMRLIAACQTLWIEGKPFDEFSSIGGRSRSSVISVVAKAWTAGVEAYARCEADNKAVSQNGDRGNKNETLPDELEFERKRCHVSR